MLLGLFARTGSAPPFDVPRLEKSFSLGGKRRFETVRRGRFTLMTTGGSPVPPTAEEPGGRRFVAASGDAYDVQGATRAAGRSPLAESLLASFVRSGAALTPPRNGTFAFVAHDNERDEIVAGNDAFGFHPLFVLERPDFVAVCSEIEPLIELAPGGGELDHDGTAEFFVFGATLGGRTLVRGIRGLDPGTILHVRGGEATRRVHDRLEIAIDRNVSFEEHARRVAAEFKAAVGRRLERHPETTASLTGGADTRLILSAMTPEQRSRVSFVTHYLVPGMEDEDRDVVIAKMLARKAGLRHEALLVEGARDDFSPDGFRRLRERPQNPHHMHGVWGGEYLGGAAVDVAMFPVEAVTREAVAAKVARIFSPEFRATIADPYDSLRADYALCRAENKEFQYWIGMFARPYMTHLYFGSAGLSASSWIWPWAQNLRLTSPFQDAEFLRTLLAVPFEHLSGYKLYNEIYRRTFTEFTDVPTNSGLAVRSDSALTMYVAGKEPKRAYKNLSLESRRRAFDALVADGRVFERGIFAADAVRAKCAAEVADAPPSMTARLKNTYTKGLLFKTRRHLPLHGMIMRWKAKHETARAAQLESTLVGAVVDFEYWCRYSGVETREPKQLARA